MRKNGFTMMEVLIVVIIAGVLATMAIPIYQNVTEDAKVKVCAANLSALQVALDVYAMENDDMPTNLNQIPQEYIRFAFDRVLKEKGAWKIKLAQAIVNFDKGGFVYAADSFIRDTLAKGNLQLVTCPSDSTPPDAVGIASYSYGINLDLAGKSSIYYRESFPASSPSIADSDAATFNVTSFTLRHKHYGPMGNVLYQSAVYVNKAKETYKCESVSSCHRVQQQ